MTQENQNISLIQYYFDSFKQGDIEKVLNTFHDNCLIISVRNEERKKTQLHGTYRTKKNAKQFLQNIANHFNPLEFNIEEIVASKQIVFANGKFKHYVKNTGKIFISDWVQRCIIEDGKIKEYRFYEDSAAFVEASKI